MRFTALGLMALSAYLLQASAASVPRTWADPDLSEWATPIAALNVRPAHFSEDEYYKAPIDNLRTYPVYYPGREPAGYWDMLQTVGEKPLVEPALLKTENDWVAAGKRVFEEYDGPAARVFDPEVISRVRSPNGFAGSAVRPNADGTLPDLRWIPTSRGVALGLVNCPSCHVRRMEDGTLLNGAPGNFVGSPILRFGMGVWGASAIPLPGDSRNMSLWRSWAVPWIQGDVHEGMKTMPLGQALQIFGAAAGPGMFSRWNGSPYYATKIPDLIGFKDRKYIDHTATHQHRGPGDLMRYAALVTYSDSSDFGPHRLLTDEQRRIPSRASDEALYALATYIYSLQPPPNPNRSDPSIPNGERVFQREGCVNCHTPPLYTNNKLTLAEGFTSPPEHAQFLDIMPISVRTDTGLALKTRKGTGYYKVPSLKGVWYRGRYLHDGSFTSLEDMFNPARLRDDFVASGFRQPGVNARAVKGHEFGLMLNAADKAALMAFLRSL